MVSVENKSLAEGGLIAPGVAISVFLLWIGLVIHLAGSQAETHQLRALSDADRVMRLSPDPASGPPNVRGRAQGFAGPAPAAAERMNRAARFDRLRLSQRTGRGLFSGDGEPNARIVLLSSDRPIATTRADAAGKWRIAAHLGPLGGVHEFALEQRGSDAPHFRSGARLRLHVPEGYRHTIDVRSKEVDTGFRFVAVRADGDDLGSASSRRFDEFFVDRPSGEGVAGMTGPDATPDRKDGLQDVARPTAEKQRDMQLADRSNDVLQPAWRWLADANRSYHRDVVPRIRRGGGYGNGVPTDDIDGPSDTARSAPDDAPIRERSVDRRPVRVAERDTQDRPAPDSGVAAGLSDWLRAARQGYSKEVVPRLKGQLPPSEVREREVDPEETADERDRRLARERDLRERAAERAEEERLTAERRRREAEEARRVAEAEARRIAEQRRQAERAEQRKVEAERQRVLERRAEERRRAELDREAQLEREQEEAERAALERQRRAELEAARESAAARRAEAVRARADAERERRDDTIAQAEALKRRLAAQRRREREAKLRDRARDLARRRARLAELEAARDRENARKAREARDRERREREARERQLAAREETRSIIPAIPGIFQRPVAPLPDPRVTGLNAGTRGDEGGGRTIETVRAGNRTRFTQRNTQIEFRTSRPVEEAAGPAQSSASPDPSSTDVAPPVPGQQTRTARRGQAPRQPAKRRTQRMSNLRSRLLGRKAKLRSSRRTRCHPRAGRRINPPGTYVVRRGDSLWRISRRHYKLGRLYRRIYRANRGKISRANLIYPCQRFHLPAKRRR